jgi:Flp pilus assembly protein TadD
MIQPPDRHRHALTPTQAFDMAVALHRQHRLGEAEQLYRAILKLEPNHFGALQYLGMIATQRGGAQEAEQLIRQALAIKPDSTEARNNLGIALAALKRFEEAIPFFESALAIGADTPETHNNLVNARFELCGSARMGRISLCRHINLLRKVPCAGPQRLARF